MQLFDRINQKNIIVDDSDLNKPILFSQYVKNNNQFFVPCDKEKVTMPNGNKLVFEKNKFIENNESLISNSLIEISDEFELIETISDVTLISPLLRNFDKRLDISEYDEFLHKYLYHIEEVCREPAYHLSREITKVNIARAKRIPVRAINYLASHSEDWSRRRIRGVEPTKILSETIEYDLQIYENKVTAKLVDKLLEYCNERMVDDIEVIQEFITEVDIIIESRSNKGENDHSWYKKRERDFDKLGSVADHIKDSKTKLYKLKEYIGALQNRLFSLLLSDLYIKNKNIHLTSDTIERTNLFDNHQHYRYVKIIWNKSYKMDVKTCEEVTLENENIINAFVDYVMILILRSLEELDFFDCKIIDKNTYEVRSGKYSFLIDIKKTEYAILEVKIDDEVIKFIPILCDAELPEFTIQKNDYYLIPENYSTHDNVIKVNPKDINSEERITKILFSKILEKYLSSYLCQLDSQDIAQFKIIQEWLLNNSDLIINKSETNKLNLFITQYISDQDEKEFKKKVQEQKGNLPDYKMRSRQLESLKMIEKLLLESREHFEKYFYCIGCGKKQVRSLKINRDSFIYNCNNIGCEVNYGNGGNGVYYHVKNIEQIRGDMDDKIGYEYIDN